MRITMMRGVCASTVVAITVQAFAGQHNYQNYMLGDRACGMGGGVIAIATCVDACYYNPAGLARSGADSISLSASLYGFQDYTADSALSPKESVTTHSFITIPSTVGVVYEVSANLFVAFSAFVPNRTLYNEIDVFLDRQHFYKYSADVQSLWNGPSVGYTLSPGR